MSHILQISDLSLGEQERAILECLWSDGPLNPGAVHARVGQSRGISVNTVSSTLKRLSDKGLLRREKVSHAYVYTAAVTRSELQRQLIGAVASQFGAQDGSGFLAAFVDLTAERGQPFLRKLEALIAEKLNGHDT